MKDDETIQTRLNEAVAAAVDATCRAVPGIDRDRLQQTFEAMLGKLCPAVAGALKNGRFMAHSGPLLPVGESMVSVIDTSQVVDELYKYALVSAPTVAVDDEFLSAVERNSMEMLRSVKKTAVPTGEPVVMPSDATMEAYHMLSRLLLDADGSDATGEGKLGAFLMAAAVYRLAKTDAEFTDYWNRCIKLGIAVMPVAIVAGGVFVTGQLTLGPCLSDDLSKDLLAGDATRGVAPY